MTPEGPPYMLSAWIRLLSKDPLLGVLTVETDEGVVEVTIGDDGAARLIRLLQMFYEKRQDKPQD